MNQLNLKRELLVIEIVLTWRDELNSVESVRNSSPVECSSSEDREKKLLPGVEQHNGSGTVTNVGGVVQVQCACVSARFG